MLIQFWRTALSARVRYEEVQCKSALNRVSGMDFRWSLNPYRGCVHGCHYCFARRYHSYFDLNVGNDFTGIILVKSNVAEVLSSELSKRSWRRESVAIGTATDPYQPIEGKYRLTRQCLQAFVDWRSPVNLVTKGTMAIRDTDVMVELEKRAGCTVCFSISTLDDDLWRKLEPGTPPPSKRLAAMERLVAAGVNAGVALAPIIPGITDDQDNLETVTKAAAEHGAKFLWGSTLRLKPGTKEHFLEFLDREYPALSSNYRQLYPGAYAPQLVQSDIQTRIGVLKASNGLAERRSRRPSPQPLQLQLALK